MPLPRHLNKYRPWYLAALTTLAASALGWGASWGYGINNQVVTLEAHRVDDHELLKEVRDDVKTILGRVPSHSN